MANASDRHEVTIGATELVASRRRAMHGGRFRARPRAYPCRRPCGVAVTLTICAIACFVIAGEAVGKQTEGRPDSEAPNAAAFEFPAMGVRFRVAVYDRTLPVSPELREKVIRRVEQIEQAFSNYREDSEINRLCRTAPHVEPVPVSDDLACVLVRANEISRITDGAFDVTVGPLTEVWRMARKRNRLPRQSAIDAALRSVGWRNVQIDSMCHVRLTKADMKIDLGGIGKGYAADAIVELLQANGVKSGVVDASGDVRVFGVAPRAAAWRIRVGVGLEDGEHTDRRGSGPDRAGASTDDVSDRSDVIICLPGGAVATSGDVYQALTIDGKRYSHIVDPRTGWPTTQIRAVTVVAPDATTADALASALAVMGPRSGVAFVNQRPGIAARFEVRQEDDRIRKVACDEWNDYLCGSNE